jgi:predicted unusual protein kinase regulating ubiquinone biosynthesis (AarF/ABC1/UbiB family)
MEGTSVVNFMSVQPVKAVMERAAISGVEDFEKIKLKLSDLGVRLILKMIFFDNFIHGDLHPGNIMVHFDKKGEPHLVILDCGIVYQAKSEEEHKKIVEICFAFLKHDGRRAGELMLDAHRQPDPERRKAFCEGVHQMVSHIIYLL